MLKKSDKINVDKRGANLAESKVAYCLLACRAESDVAAQTDDSDNARATLSSQRAAGGGKCTRTC